MKKGVKIIQNNNSKILIGEGYYEGRNITNLKDLVKNSVQNYGDKTCFKFKNSKGEIDTKNYIQFGSDIECLGTALISLGLKNKNIGVIGENRYEWGVSYYSIVNGTGTVVPLDKYLPQAEIENLINRGKLDAIFYSPSFHDTILKISKNNTCIKHFICMEEIDTNLSSEFSSIPKLIEIGKKLIDSGNLDFINAKIDEHSPSILLFTSGTTSMSKGVQLSHSNIASDVTAITRLIKLFPTDVHLSLLPLHHTFENTLGLSFMIHQGVPIAFCEGIKHISQNIKEFNISIIIAVPAILEAIYKKVKEGIRKSGKENTFNKLVKIANIADKIGINLKKPLFKGIRGKLGENLRIIVSGAAALDQEVILGYKNLGLILLQGYGLTETSPVICATSEYYDKVGTVGFPLAGFEVSIENPDENGIGQIITRGKNIMIGYFEDEKSTKEVLTNDGWFKTGDLGFIDDEGYIKITGRAKSMIVLTNGKKAFPEEYESVLNSNDEIKDSFVWGHETSDGDVIICAKIIPNRDKFTNKTDDQIITQINSIIKNTNTNIPKYKIIRYFVLTDNDFIKTTTLKIKRHDEEAKMKKYLNENNTDMRKISNKFIQKENS